MNHNHNDDAAREAGLQLMPVRFEFTHPTAGTVGIAGTFNQWHPTTKSMRAVGSGHWLKEMFLSPGTYEYRLVVDGQWIPDPLARETVPNSYGGRNSILNVGSSLEATHRADAEKLPLGNANKQKAKKI